MENGRERDTRRKRAFITTNCNTEGRRKRSTKLLEEVEEEEDLSKKGFCVCDRGTKEGGGGRGGGGGGGVCGHPRGTKRQTPREKEREKEGKKTC